MGDSSSRIAAGLGCTAALALSVGVARAEPIGPDPAAPQQTPPAQPQPGQPQPTQVPPGYAPTPQAAPGYAPAPGYGYPPPSYGYAPGTPGGYPYGYQPPPTLRYREGQPIPPGYRVESHPRTGLLIAGGLVVGVPWAFSVMAAVESDFDNGSGWLLVPVLGPWGNLYAREDRCDEVDEFGDPVNCGEDVAIATVLILDGIIQFAGGVLFTVGLLAQKTQLVREDTARVHVTPRAVGRNGYGVGVSGSF